MARPANLAPKVLRRARLLPRLNVTTTLRMGEARLTVPLRGGTGYENLRPTEPWLMSALTALVGWRPGAFLDVGVNVGQTLLKFASLRQDGAYCGFEPNTLAAAYVDELIERNGFSWAQVVPAALSDSNGAAVLHTGSALDSSGSVVEDFRDPSSYTRSRVVVMVDGDEVLERLALGPISIIKIDVEGAELDVLRGLRSTLASERPLVFCENLPVHDVTTERGIERRRRTDALVALVHGLDYEIDRLLHDGSRVTLTDIETHADLTLTDYLFVPVEARQAVEERFARSTG